LALTFIYVSRGRHVSAVKCGYHRAIIQQYTGCFTTLGHSCRRWFPRPLWWKKFI